MAQLGKSVPFGSERLEVRILLRRPTFFLLVISSVHFCAWLNLVERSVRVGEIGGSKPPAQTAARESTRIRHADVAQPVEAAVSETVCCEGSNPSVGTNVQRSLSSDRDAITSPWWNWHTRQLEVLGSSGV